MHDNALFLLGFAALLFLYMLPWWIAVWRDHPQHLAIGMLDLFLGWSGLGWVAALIWSCTATEVRIEQPAAAPPPPPDPADLRHCPYCDETIRKAATLCRYCGRKIEEKDEG